MVNNLDAGQILSRISPLPANYKTSDTPAEKDSNTGNDSSAKSHTIALNIKYLVRPSPKGRERYIMI